MRRYCVTTEATVRRRWYIDADSTQGALAKSVDLEPDEETDVHEETLTVDPVED